VVSGPASAAPHGGAGTELAATPPYQTITTERIGLVQRITLNRPEKRNALSLQLQDELIHAVREAETSNEVRAIVLRGAGPSTMRSRTTPEAAEFSQRIREHGVRQAVAERDAKST
jgi:1,4-dihydroxy-2-naphthoyl-CoA synthase